MKEHNSLPLLHATRSEENFLIRTYSLNVSPAKNYLFTESRKAKNRVANIQVVTGITTPGITTGLLCGFYCLFMANSYPLDVSRILSWCFQCTSLMCWENNTMSNPLSMPQFCVDTGNAPVFKLWYTQTCAHNKPGFLITRARAGKYALPNGHQMTTPYIKSYVRQQFFKNVMTEKGSRYAILLIMTPFSYVP